MARDGVMVTGASGFVGSRLVERLRADGRRVSVLLRDGSKEPRFRTLGCHVFRGDVTLPDTIGPALADCGSVIHCARGGSDLEGSREVNVKGTLNVLAAARAAGLARVVHVSSVVAQGRRWPSVLTEDFPLQFEGDPYAVTKAESEREALAFARAHGVEVVIVRPTIVYGPGSGRVLSDLERVRYERIKLVDHGRGVLNLVYIDDLIDGLCLAETAPRAAGETFLVSGAAPVTVRDYFGRLAALAGKPSAPGIGTTRARLEAVWGRWHYRFTREPKRVEDTDLELMGHREAVSIEKARRLMGFAPRVSLEDGMRRVGEWLGRLGYVAAASGA
jgi:nucleoside-diphosphate-sugar epimerase